MSKKKMFKKAVAVASVFALTASSAAYAGAAAPEAGKPKYKAGEYTAAEYGFGGEVKVTVTVDDEKIVSVKVEGPSETAGIGSKAIDELPEAFVKANDSKVDVAAGATVTSKAIMMAVEKALAEASKVEETAETAGSEAVMEAIEKALAEATGAGADVDTDAIMAAVERALAGEEAIIFTPGTYTTTARGYNGDITLDVTFSKYTIKDIVVKSSRETAHVGTSAFDVVIPDIIEYTSTGVDALAGATVTSRAIIAAVEAAAEEAGCDIPALRAGEKPFELVAGEKIEDTFDVVVVGAGGAGMAAAASAAQNGATVLVIEKMAEMGGNTLVSGGSFQAVLDDLVWDRNDPFATEVVKEDGTVVKKVKSDAGRLGTLQMILDWDEKAFDGTVKDPDAISTVEDYDLPSRGVHEEYLETLIELKAQITDYMAYADEFLADENNSASDLTIFSSVELHVFQTYYGGIRINDAKDEWIYNNYDLVYQVCSQAADVKEWLTEQGGVFRDTQGTLLGCLWQRIVGFSGGVVDNVNYSGQWGVYFKVPENTVLTANEKNDIMYRTTVTGLITDGDRVVGVKAVKYDGTEVEIKANNGVILATGGFGANIEMVMETNEYWYEGDLNLNTKTTNRGLATGDGIIMAQEVGAATTGMGFTQLLPSSFYDTGALAGAAGENLIYLGAPGTENEGIRFVDESQERDVLSRAQFDNGMVAPNGVNGVVVELTANSFNRTSANNVEGRTYFCTIEEAAEVTGLSAEAIEKAIREYDAIIIGESEGPFDPPKMAYRNIIGSCQRDENGRYIADTYKIETVQVRFICPSTHHTMGGLVVDTDRHVLNEDGDVIPGLYAAGEVTGGIFAGNRLGGNAITEILVSGRIAGGSAAAGK